MQLSEGCRHRGEWTPAAAVSPMWSDEESARCEAGTFGIVRGCKKGVTPLESSQLTKLPMLSVPRPLSFLYMERSTMIGRAPSRDSTMTEALPLFTVSAML